MISIETGEIRCNPNCTGTVFGNIVDKVARKTLSNGEMTERCTVVAVEAVRGRKPYAPGDVLMNGTHGVSCQAIVDRVISDRKLLSHSDCG